MKYKIQLLILEIILLYYMLSLWYDLFPKKISQNVFKKESEFEINSKVMFKFPWKDNRIIGKIHILCGFSTF